MARLNPRLNLPTGIRQIAGRGGNRGPTILGGSALAATAPHALDGPEHTPPTQGGDLEGAGATQAVAKLQGLDIKTMATAHLLGRNSAGAGKVESLSAATVAAMLEAAGLLPNPMTAAGDLITEAAGGTLNNTVSPTGNVLVVTGLAETIFPGCDLTVIGPITGSATVAWDVWLSESDYPNPKAETIRLRRTNATGAILATHNVPDSGDHTGGHTDEWASSFVDTAPTDGHYVLTVQETAGTSGTQIYSDTRTFSVTTVGGAARLAKGPDGDVFTMDPTTHLPGWLTSPKGLPLGLTGAVQATRYVGATTSGHPTTGTFAVGDFVIDLTPAVWVCTAAGSPGTWASLSGGGSGIEITDGTHDITGATKLTVTGGTVGGSTPNATLLIPAGSLEVKEIDGSPDVTGVSVIQVTNGTLTDNGGGNVTIATGGGGGSTPKIYSAALGSDVTFNPTPIPATAITGLSVTLPASASARTVLVSLGLVGNPTNYRPDIILDTTYVSPQMAKPGNDGDGYSFCGPSNWPLTIPGDSATHVVKAALEASGGTASSTVKTGSWITVIDGLAS